MSLETAIAYTYSRPDGTRSTAFLCAHCNAKDIENGTSARDEQRPIDPLKDGESLRTGDPIIVYCDGCGAEIARAEASP